jgi:hypothetical protein
VLVLILEYVFKGEECLAAHHQCSNRGVMPFAHWRVSPPPKGGGAPCLCNNAGAIPPCTLEGSSAREGV